MSKKRLPVGIQTFEKIRDPKENYIYVDKTELAYNLITDNQYYFLSRPRRFGKSLFLDTLANIFSGNKELFEGLYIYDKWNWDDVYPVIKISFGSGSYTQNVLIDMEFERIFRQNNECFDLEIEYGGLNTVRKSLDLLINACYRKFNKKVVILVDEYDKPILDNIANEDKSMPREARTVLKNLYSVLKDNDDKIRFVFLTGVSKFSKLNLFSGLNNLEDITLSPRFATITGYTHGDVQRHFTDYLEGVDLEKVKQWYNGYNYFGEPIYNPFDILLFFSNDCRFENYWWETGNPSFLVQVLKQDKHYLPELENMTVSKETLNAFDVEHIDIVALLWQTGYLTFDKEVRLMDFVLYKMKVPNLEIQSSLNSLFFDYLTSLGAAKASKQLSAVRAVIGSDINTLEQTIRSLFAAIPYDNYVNNSVGLYEGYYASVLYTFLSTLSFNVIPEDHTNQGRIDMALVLPDKVYIFEFKVDQPEETAIKQIKEKRYSEKYQNDGKQVFLIGMHFSSEEKNISSFEWEQV